MPALTLKAEKKGRKIIIPEDILVKRIEVHHESGSITSFIPLIARPKVFRPKIRMLDDEKPKICFTWLDQELYTLRRDTWYKF